MDLFDPFVRKIFFDVHKDLLREGPGNRASTLRAIDALGELPANLAILDIGCGPGQQSLDLLTQLPDATLTGVDLHQPFLDVAQERITLAGFSDQASFEKQDMSRLKFDSASFDLIWCEGAAYIIGIETALRLWAPLLKANGKIALTECVFLTETPPQLIKDWWLGNYPGMKHKQQCLQVFRDNGFGVLADFVLPDEAWLDSYYTPMESRITSLRQSYANNPGANLVLDDCQLEIDYYRAYSAHYGYYFICAEKLS